MIRFLCIILVQSLCLCAGQVMLKYALQAMGAFSLSWNFISRQLTNWWFLGCGMCFVAAGVMWMYIIKHYPLSVAYPMSSITYVFAMFAAIVLFGEHVAWTQWIGVLLIISGCALIAR